MPGAAILSGQFAAVQQAWDGEGECHGSGVAAGVRGRGEGVGPRPTIDDLLC